MIVLHNDFFLGYEFFHSNLQMIRPKRGKKKNVRNMRTHECEWKNQNDNEKRRSAPTTTAKPKLKRIRIRLECFFLVSPFFSSHLLYLNWSVSTFSRMDISILGILYVIFFYNKSLAVRMGFFSFRFVSFFFYARTRLSVIFLRQTNVPVKNEISSFQIHWYGFVEMDECERSDTHAHTLTIIYLKNFSITCDFSTGRCHSNTVCV